MGLDLKSRPGMAGMILPIFFAALRATLLHLSSKKSLTREGREYVGREWDKISNKGREFPPFPAFKVRVPSYITHFGMKVFEISYQELQNRFFRLLTHSTNNDWLKNIHTLCRNHFIVWSRRKMHENSSVDEESTRILSLGVWMATTSITQFPVEFINFMF